MPFSAKVTREALTPAEREKRALERDIASLRVGLERATKARDEAQAMIETLTPQLQEREDALAKLEATGGG